MRIKRKLREIELGINKINIHEEGEQLGRYLLDKGYLDYLTSPIVKYEIPRIKIPNGIDGIITNAEGKCIAIKYKFTMNWLTSLEPEYVKPAFKQCEQLNIDNLLIITNHTKASSSVYTISKQIKCHIIGRTSIASIADKNHKRCIVS